MLFVRYAIVSLAPVVVFAQTFGSLVDSLVGIIGTLIVIVAALALLVFFYGMALYVFRMGSGSADSHTSGYNLMIWGILILFVMASVWGIVSLVSGSFF